MRTLVPSLAAVALTATVAPTVAEAQRAGAAIVDGAGRAVSAETRRARVPAPTPRWHEAAVTELAWRGSLHQVVPLGDHVAIAGFPDERPTVALVAVATGAIVASRELEAGCALPSSDAPTVLLAKCGAALVAIDPATLAERWRMPFEGDVRALSARRDLVIAGLGHEKTHLLVAFDATGGRERWRATVPTDRTIGISEDAARVYPFEGDPTVWALDRVTGALVWTAPMEPFIHDVLPLPDGTLAVARADGIVRLDAATGADRPALVTGEHAAVDVHGAWLHRVDPGAGRYRGARLTGRELASGRTWTYDRPIAPNVVTSAGPLVYACSPAGVLHAIDAETGAGRWWADVGGRCDAFDLGTHTLAILGSDRLALIDHTRASTAPRVTIRGTFVDGVGEGGVANKRIWIGDQQVRTDARGRFRATVRRGPAVSIRIDPRDVDAVVDEQILYAGDDPTDVRITTYYEDCH